MAVRQILPNQTLEDLRLQFNALSAQDFGDIGTLDASLAATTVIGAVNELSAQVGAAEGWKMEDSSSTIQQIGAGQTARFFGASNQINAIVSVPDTLTLSLTDSVTLVTSLTAPTVNAGTLSISSGYITDSSGTISFDNENITTNTFVLRILEYMSLMTSMNIDTLRLEFIFTTLTIQNHCHSLECKRLTKNYKM